MKIILSLQCLLLLYPATLFCQVDVLTQHNDLNRTGWNSHETVLNTSNLREGKFKKLFTRTVDDQICAQPLIVTNTNIVGVGKKNVLIVATVNNSVYAFDAEDESARNPYWQINLTPLGNRPPKNSDMRPPDCDLKYLNFHGNIGIVGTPVIDKDQGTLYIVSRNTDGITFQQYLHALDIASGAEKKGSPVLITARINREGGNKRKMEFDALKQNQRPGLLLLNGMLYVSYGSHCDWNPYHGWILGYDAASLQQKIVFNTTPNGNGGGIWMSGAAPSADESGNIYVTTGNGSGSNELDNPNKAQSVLKLTPSNDKMTLKVVSFFTPHNHVKLNDNDTDFGATEILLIPGTNPAMAVTGSKEGKLYLLNRDSLGGYSRRSNNVVQVIDLGIDAHFRSSLAYYKSDSSEFVYVWSENSLLKAFPFNRANRRFDTDHEITGSPGPYGGHGAFLSVSSNGAEKNSAILWASHAYYCDASVDNCGGVLRAFDANNIAVELWNSRIVESDSVGNYAKFVEPVVANGKVYLATFSNNVAVYGLAKESKN